MSATSEVPPVADGAAPQAIGRVGLSADWPFTTALAAAEVGLIAVMVGGRLPIGIGFAIHIGLIAGLAAWAMRRPAAVGDHGSRVLALLATAVGGPAGALSAVVALWLLGRVDKQPEVLGAWYRRIALAGDTDPVTRLCNTVAMGRGVLTSRGVPPVFAQVMTTGSLEDRQSALGLIARRFDPAYAPALKAALVSSEPVIRVQAAAVAVKVRAELATVLSTLLATAHECGLPAASTPPAELLALAARIAAIGSSGLVEDDARRRAHAAADALVALAAASLADWPEGQAVTLADHARPVIEEILLRQGAFATLRMLRATSTLPARPGQEAALG